MADKQQHKTRVCFIINPVSGRVRQRRIVEVINSEIDTNKFDVDIKYTESAGHARILTNQAIADKSDIIVAVGGDGTINEIAGEMINKNVVLGIIPRGSGNGLSRHLGIPLSAKKAVQLINTSNISRIDTAEINGRKFISIAGVGFDALVAKRFAKTKDRGFLNYFKIVSNGFLKYKPKKYKLHFHDGHSIKVKAFFIAFANSNQFGYDTKIAPNASLIDGQLDVCIVSKPSILDLPDVVSLLLLKRIDRSPLVQVIPAKQVDIRRKKNRTVNIDGEPVKLQKHLHIKVNPLSLKIMIP